MIPTGGRLGAAILGLGIGLLAAVSPSRADAWRLTGKGRDIALGETPLLAELTVPIADGCYTLSADGQAQSIDAVVFQDGARRLLGTILPEVPAKRPFAFVMKGRASGESPSADGIRFRAQGENLAVTMDHEPFTEYRVDAGKKPFFYPLIGPTGDSFTRAYPMAKVAGEDFDHPHQRSLWFTHGNVSGVDFWSETRGSGTIRETARKVVAEGPVLGRLRTSNEWRAPAGRVICEDERTITFYKTKELRIVDFEVTVKATRGAVIFGDTKEGMFGLRVASSMDVTKKTGGRITNADGLTDEKAWGQPSRWVDYVGPVNQKTVGIAVLNHPDSFRYPTTWHVRTYGLFAANPFGWHDFGRPDKGDYTVPEGQSIRFGYRIILHRGDTASTGIPQLFAAYAAGPSIDVRAE
jgi:hypothetical protein